MNRNPIEQQWLHWFDQLSTDEGIKDAAYSPGIPIQTEPNMPASDVLKKLDTAWEGIFLPGPQHLQILRMLVDQAMSFSRSTCPTLKEYNQQRSSEIQNIASPPSIYCLSGIAGISKSSLLKAFERICRIDPANPVMTDGQRLVLLPVRRISIEANSTTNSVLGSLANRAAVRGKKLSDINELLKHLRDSLRATCTATVALDELQFFTQSASASTRTVQLIMALASLGAPLIYVANYSLGHKLTKRPNEETDRLLSNPIILEPPAADSVYWIEVITEYLAVSPAHFHLDPRANAQELHRLTAGLFRKLRLLLLAAYRIAVDRETSFVTMEEVRLAYRSSHYSVHRKDVEDLASLAVSDLLAERRQDLVCPFKSVGNARSRTSSTSSSVSPIVRIDSPTAMLESTISKDAQATLKALRREANQPPEQRKQASVTRLPRRTPVSAESLHDGAQLLRGVLAKSPSSSSKSLPPSDGRPGQSDAGTS